MHSNTRNYITVYGFDEQDFDYLESMVDCSSTDFFHQVVPHLEEWGRVSHIEMDDLEYDSRAKELSFSCQTKWFGPVGWLRAASCTQFFENKLMTMATITRDETHVTGVAALDRDILQDHVLLELEPEKVGEMYENDEVDELDELLWKPINEFNNECKAAYIVPPEVC